VSCGVRGNVVQSLGEDEVRSYQLTLVTPSRGAGLALLTLAKALDARHCAFQPFVRASRRHVVGVKLGNHVCAHGMLVHRTRCRIRCEHVETDAGCHPSATELSHITYCAP